MEAILEHHDVTPRAPFQPRAGAPGAAGGARSRKVTATLCVMGWSAFWVFGFLALSADFDAGKASVLAEMAAAAIGFALGMVTYLDLCRDAPSRARQGIEAPDEHPLKALDDELKDEA